MHVLASFEAEKLCSLIVGSVKSLQKRISSATYTKKEWGPVNVLKFSHCIKSQGFFRNTLSKNELEITAYFSKLERAVA